MNIFSDDTNRESGTKQHWWIFPDTFPPDTDRGMDVITSQSHYKQFMISQRWARDRDTVETYASLVFLFIFSQSPSSSPSLFSTLSASCTPRSRNRFTRMSDEWWWRACRECRDTMSTWQNRKMEEGESCVHAYLSNARLWKRPRLLVGNIFALRCSKRTRRIEPLLLPWKHRRNACSCNGIETKPRWNEAGSDSISYKIV